MGWQWQGHEGLQGHLAVAGGQQDGLHPHRLLVHKVKGNYKTKL